jgi:hypothetical protein
MVGRTAMWCPPGFGDCRIAFASGGSLPLGDGRFSFGPRIPRRGLGSGTPWNLRMNPTLRASGPLAGPANRFSKFFSRESLDP